jgi:hypothetical protein
MSRFFPVAAPKKGLSVGTCAVGSVAVGRVEVSIHAKVQGAAIVVGRAAQVVEVEEHDFHHGRVSDISVCREAADSIVDGRRGGRVKHIHVLIAEEVGIERHTQKSALTR